MAENTPTPEQQTSPQTTSPQTAPDTGGDELLSEIRQAANDAVAPLSQRIDEISERQNQAEQQIQQLGQPRPGPQPSQLFGGAPGVRSGEDPMTSRGYSITRVIGLLQGTLGLEDVKVERDIHNKLQQTFVREGNYKKEKANSFLVPFGARHIQDINSDLGSEVRQCMVSGVTGSDPEQVVSLMRQHATLGDVRFALQQQSVRQTLSTYDETAGGALRGLPERGELIELQRAKEILSRVGAQEITLPPGGRMQFTRQTGATTAHWVGESTQISASDVSTGLLDLIAKKLAILSKVPNELVRFATPSIEQFIRNDMAAVAARKVDSAALTQASSSVAPKGISNYDNVTDLTGNANTVSTGNNGDTLLPKGLARLQAKVADNDHDLEGFAYVMRPLLWESILNARADAVTGGDSAGDFLFQVNRAAIEAGAPMTLRGRPVFHSTTVPNNRSKGSASDLTMLFGGVWSEWLLARAGVLEFSLSTQGDTPFQNDESWIRAVQHLDMGPRHETAFAFVDDLLEEF